MKCCLMNSKHQHVGAEKRSMTFKIRPRAFRDITGELTRIPQAPYSAGRGHSSQASPHSDPTHFFLIWGRYLTLPHLLCGWSLWATGRRGLFIWGHYPTYFYLEPRMLVLDNWKHVYKNACTKVPCVKRYIKVKFMHRRISTNSPAYCVPLNDPGSPGAIFWKKS